MPAICPKCGSEFPSDILEICRAFQCRCGIMLGAPEGGMPDCAEASFELVALESRPETEEGPADLVFDEAEPEAEAARAEQKTVIPGPKAEQKTVIPGPKAEQKTVIPGPKAEQPPEQARPATPPEDEAITFSARPDVSADQRPRQPTDSEAEELFHTPRSFAGLTGVDAVFAVVAVDRGFVLQRDIEACVEELAARRAQGEHLEIAELLMDKGLLTKAQAARLRVEMETGEKLHDIAGYRIVGKLGQGGMGTVYRARQLSLNREVAMKILPQHMSRDAGFVQRFVREAESAGRLHHPSIVQAIDVGEDRGFYYYVMELVDGQTVRDLLKRVGKLPVSEALRITVEVARALDYAWKEIRLIHRDIKPDNILIDRHGVVKLADLGLAKSSSGQTALTITGEMMGTPDYISPEQIKGDKDIDQRSDIYSLGCTLFHMVAGQPPYASDTTAMVLMGHMKKTAANPRTLRPGLPNKLAMFITHMIAKNPAMRPQSHAAVADYLSEILSEYETEVPDGAETAQFRQMLDRRQDEAQAADEEAKAADARAFQESLKLLPKTTIASGGVPEMTGPSEPEPASEEQTEDSTERVQTVPMQLQRGPLGKWLGLLGVLVAAGLLMHLIFSDRGEQEPAEPVQVAAGQPDDAQEPAPSPVDSGNADRRQPPPPKEPPKPPPLTAAEVDPGVEPPLPPPLPRRELSGNLLRNAHFTGVGAWLPIYGSERPDRTHMETSAGYVIWQRDRGHGLEGHVGVAQELDINVSDADRLTLSLDVWIFDHSQTSVGHAGTRRGSGPGESPVHLTVHYHDADLNLHRWDYCFLLDGRSFKQDPKTGRTIYYTGFFKNVSPVPKAEWAQFSFDLMDEAVRTDPRGNQVLPPPAKLLRLTVYGSGWNFKAAAGNMCVRKEAGEEEQGQDNGRQ